MSRVKLIVLILLAIAALTAAGFFLYPSPQTTSFTLPDTPERRFLAEEQARCAGIFHVFRVTLKKGTSYYEEFNKEYTDAYVRHATAAAKLHFDEETSTAQIHQASLALGKRLEEIVARNDDVKNKIKDVKTIEDAETSECQRVELKTIAFVERALQAHAARR
ncbi:hypothetical protein [Curvibacter sp. PAE-UM]|uniref:hypothetical protein n=1 Tax=Curvibacter sp. PAE-UM TaxID=1714344 RepID=UPI0012E36069|nr:hypothetical protein [Curvibacter sp. PAE-UM]